MTKKKKTRSSKSKKNVKQTARRVTKRDRQAKVPNPRDGKATHGSADNTPDPASAKVLKGGSARRSKRVAKTQLEPGDLRWTCPPLSPGSRQPSLSSLLGQDRPVAAMRTGLSLYAQGYNIFVSGTVGSGRTRLVTDLIRRLKPAGQLVSDRVFVSNFHEPNRPKLITVPRGEGPRFRDEMRELVLTIQATLQSALRSRTHRVSHDLVVRTAGEREKRLMAALNRQAEKAGFRVVQFPGANGGMMADIYPLFENEAVNPEAFRELVSQGRVSNARYLKLRGLRDNLMERLEEVTERLLRAAHDTDEELGRMDAQVAGHMLKGLLRRFSNSWDNAEVDAFLEGLRDYILKDLGRWVEDISKGEVGDYELGEGELTPPAPPAPSPSQVPSPRGEPVRILGVEVHVVKTSQSDECPVVLETHPTYSNLFGVVEPARDGHIPSVAQVHPGSLLRSDGGYLILRLAELMGEPGVWTQLKRALKVGRVEIREFDPNSGVTSGTLHPEAVPINLKVILIGEPGNYETLAVEDMQFLQTFKVHAEFDTVLPMNKGNMRRYADLLDWFRRREGLLPFNAEANATVVEHGARVAGRRDRLTARFGELADLAREASHLSSLAKATQVTREHVLAALAARMYRSDLGRDIVERDFKDGYLLIQTKGEVVGQINAMTVIESDALLFGKPSRVTVATGVGQGDRAGVVNIEREAELSGPLHDKGVMILHGYLLDQFAGDGPLSLQAAICFEQTYGGVDGDSASGAELCALLSSLAEIPIRQSFGVTGAINQRGQVQAVSAVNEKIEGFFRLCKRRGLDGSQGVIFPKVNVVDLMLDHEVVQAVADGKFQVHAVDHIDQMLELLTGETCAKVRAATAERLRTFRGWAGGG
ncbi:MAG: AAA family ATPase [Planctomycetota bacterium]|nr:AAA family ATPase [Planctomycetota bacterium]